MDAPAKKGPLALEHALLGLLRAQPMHAYEMHQRLEQSSQSGALGRIWHLKQSHLYALLTRLEDAGYISAALEQQGTRPPRRMLALTAAGRESFDAWRAAPVRHGRDFRQEFLAKLFFASAEGPAAAAQLIERQRVACQQWHDDLRVQAEAVRSERRYDWLVIEFRRSQIEAIIAWLDLCSTTLTALPAG